MGLNKIKGKLIDIYDRWTAKNCMVSIGDVMNCRGNIEHNQFLVSTRVLDIEDYCEKGIKNFKWQNTVSRAAYGESHREDDGNKAFSNLIRSYVENGYDSSSIFTLDENGRLLDGNHRMGMNIYTGVSLINVRILKRKSKNPKTIDWYLAKKIDSSFIQTVLDKFDSIQELLVMTGNTFSAIVKDVDDFDDYDSLVQIKRTRRFSDVTSKIMWGGYNLPENGVLIQFTLDDPAYKFVDGNLISMRIEEIKKIIRARCGSDDRIQMCRNCKEGKVIFDALEQYFE